ncbi:MAG: GNAT family N-acetyltransferase [Myxococcota bacterium]
MADPDDLTVRLLDHEEASLLVALIRRCYGETYIDPSFYDEAGVRGRLACGDLSSVGAFTALGELVGHMGITRRSWGGNTADAGMTLVDPAHRGRGIARKVAVGLAEQSIAMELVGVHDYPVTVHGATQRLAKGYGTDTGLMLANMPGDVSFEDMQTDASAERTSSLVRWLPFGRAPTRDVYLPPIYADYIRTLYEEALLSRTLRESETADLAGATELDTRIDGRRQIARFTVARSGADLADRVSSRLKEAGGVVVAHLDLPLGDLNTPRATEALRGLGFFFSALLPEYHDGDVLRLQWLATSVQVAEAEVVARDATRAIEAYVVEDRASLS